MEPATSRSPSIASERPLSGPGRIWFASGALAGLAGVALKAYGGHAPAGLAETARTWIGLAGDFALLHAPALLIVALLAGRQAKDRKLLRLAGALFAVGVLCFSGGLAARAIAGWHLLGPVIPFGGTALLLAWSCLLLYALPRRF